MPFVHGSGSQRTRSSRSAAAQLIERLRRSPVEEGRIDEVISEACGAHVCRCTGHVRYYEAIRDVIRATPGAVE